jgi:hypothetical protein
MSDTKLATISELPVATVTPMMMLQTAVAQNADLDKLEKLMQLQERWEANEGRKAFNQAFTNFKDEAVRVIKRTSITAGPLNGKKYADLFSVVDAVTPALSKHGLNATWKISKDEKDWIEVTCSLRHVLGHSESVTMGGQPDTGGAKNSIQARASTVNYLERYTLKAICGIAEQGEDNDGRGSGKDEVEPDAEGKKALEACGSLNALSKVWNALTKEQRLTLAAVKEEMKQTIQKADAP